MNGRLYSSRLKLERADKHIADIQARIRALPDSYTATIERNPNLGNKVIKHDLSDTSIATDLALMIGDAVHNQKCALDHAWVRAVERFVPSAVGKFAKFPVYPSRNELEIALNGREINVTAPELLKLIVSDIQPYDGGNNSSIWTIHKLDILDKHRLLIPVVSFAAIDGIEVENERGETEQGSTWGTTQKPPYFVPIEPGWHIKNKGHVSVSVVFDKGTPAYGMDVSEMLSTLGRVVSNVVQLLEQLLG